MNLDILRNGYNSQHHKNNSHAGHFFVKMYMSYINSNKSEWKEKKTMNVIFQ